MGFDLMGQKAKNKSGEYFRNNVWWWRNLWFFVTLNCQRILTREEMDYGNWNAGKKIVKQKADRIVKKLKETIADGTAKEFEDQIAEVVKDAKEHNRKLEKGMSDPDYEITEHYPFTVENLKGFIKFVENSGGFRIF
jgi:hypothetical protein